MYQLIDIKKSISEYLIFNNNLVTSTANNLLLNDEIVFSAKKTYISKIKKYNQTVYIFEYKVGLTYFNIETPNVKITRDFIKGIALFINEKDIIYSRRLSNDCLNRNTIRINLDTLEKRWEIKSYFGSGKIFNDAIFAVCSGGKICKIPLTKPQTPLWQFDLSQFGTFRFNGNDLPYKVEKIIGIHKERLYVALNGAMLLVINIETGELTHQWQNIMTTERGFSYPVETNTFTLDKQLGKLVSFYTSDFITIDLSSKKVNITPMDEELNKFDGRTFKPMPSNYAIDETHIYTLVSLYAPEANFIKESIVAFNKQTKKIDWHYTDNQFGIAGGDSPKIAGNKLYLKVNITNLYIFEKTSNENV